MPACKTVLFDIRCTNCNALLFKGFIESGHIERKCKCGVINTIMASLEVKQTIHMPLPITKRIREGII